jgi:hypothetical protein
LSAPGLFAALLTPNPCPASKRLHSGTATHAAILIDHFHAEAAVQISPSTALEVPYRGEAHRATYFVENGMVHAEIGGRTMLAPAIAQAPADVVRTLLVGTLEQQRRRLRLVSSWQAWHDTARRLSAVGEVDAASTR